MENDSDHPQRKMKRCYYDILNVDKKATQDEIKKVIN